LVLVIALIQQKRILLYRDALGGHGQKYTNAIMRYLGDEMLAKCGKEMIQTQWDVQSLRSSRTGWTAAYSCDLPE
jgi:hypothetical protein